MASGISKVFPDLIKLRLEIDNHSFFTNGVTPLGCCETSMSWEGGRGECSVDVTQTPSSVESQLASGDKERAFWVGKHYGEVT